MNTDHFDIHPVVHCIDVAHSISALGSLLNNRSYFAARIVGMMTMGRQTEASDHN